MHPAELIPRNIANFRRQLERIGGMFDWRHALSTTDPDYYKWTQWIFLQLLKAGKAYKKKAAVNWCPFDKTVLANEQVVDGKCERCGDGGGAALPGAVVLPHHRVLRTAARPISTRSTGRTPPGPPSATGWGGAKARRSSSRSRAPGGAIAVFTTRPDTLFGATFMVLAPEHPLVAQADHRGPEGRRSRPTCGAAAAQDLVTRKVGDREKTGVFTGAYAINPVTGKPVPVWIADYVLMEYGTGAIMAVPAHDERDFAFATKYGLEIVRVLSTAEGPVCLLARLDAADRSRHRNRWHACWSTPGRFDGMTADDGQARRSRSSSPAEGRGKGVVQYRLHDWCISRQRYWGPPIPVIYCDGCGRGAGAGKGSARAAARRSRTSAPTIPASHRSLATRSGTTSPVPPAASGPVARPTSRTPFSTRPGTTCATRAPSSTTGPLTWRGPGPGVRSRPTSAATSTRCCTCSTPASWRWY